MSRLALPAVLAALVALAAGLFLAGGSGEAAGANRAGLVIAFPEGAQTLWVDFDEPEISGAELLERAGLDVTFSSFGGLGGGVCSIEGVGCQDPGNCFCQCQSGSCHYWAYFKLDDDGDWAYQPFGASTRKLRDGDVDGWAWGSGTPPPEMVSAVPCPTPHPPPPATGGAPTAAPPGATGGASTSGGSAPSANAAGVAAPPSSASTPVPAAGEDAPAAPTPVPTPDARDALRRVEGAQLPDGPTGRAVAGRAESPASDGGTPAGLIAFGAVVAAMTLGLGAVAVGRRLRG